MKSKLEQFWDKEFDDMVNHQYDDEILNLESEYNDDLSDKERKFYSGE